MKRALMLLEQLSGWFGACARQFAARGLTGACFRARSDESRALEDAYRDWVAARMLFDCVSEPELVDYAIYSLQATEKHFVYLWKKARECV